MSYVFFLTGLYFLIITIYLSISFILGCMPSKKTHKTVENYKRFAIIIPAHNEAKIILRTLESIKKLDYPEHLYTVFVIADNCDDNTAEVVRKAGITCIERNDKKRRGKGFALQYLYQKAIERNWQFDAFVGVDADTVVSGNLLLAMNAKLNEGHKVLTTVYNILTPEKSPTLSLSYIGFFMRNIRNKGKNKLGCSIPLYGNGMCISYDIIKKFGWHATSITEDREYWALLHLQNIRVEFVDNAHVLAELPMKFKEYEIPRARWDIGRFQFIRKFFLPFINRWLYNRNFVNFEALLELITPPLTLFIDLLILFSCLALFVINWKSFSAILYYTSLFLLCISILPAIILAKFDLRVFKNLLLYTPYFMLWRPWNLFKRSMTKSRVEWLKSKRNE
jgi:cellulose synthase/poly-beta-1,6-N-acetylglucosamine synthase-like glycosyltransferase